MLSLKHVFKALMTTSSDVPVLATMIKASFSYVDSPVFGIPRP